MFQFIAQANTAANMAANTADIAPTNTPDVPKTGIGWLDTLLMVLVPLIMAVVSMFLIPFLKQKAAAAAEEAARIRSEKTGQDLTNKETLLAMLKAFLLDGATRIAERRFPELAKKVLSGKLPKEEGSIKAELHAWGKELKDAAIEHFKGLGVDIVAAVGDKYLDQLIELVANKVSPFPGKETTVALLKEWDGKAIQFLLDKGVDWVRGKFESDVNTSK